MAVSLAFMVAGLNAKKKKIPCEAWLLGVGASQYSVGGIFCWISSKEIQVISKYAIAFPLF